MSFVGPHRSQGSAFTPQLRSIDYAGGGGGANDEYILSNANGALGFTNGSIFSIGLWLNTDTVAAGNRMALHVRNNVDNANAISFTKISTTTFRGIIEAPLGSFFLAQVTSLAVDTWYFALLTSAGTAGGDKSFYWNGSLVTPTLTAATTVVDEATRRLLVGVNRGLANFWDGTVFGYAVWDADVSAAQSDLYNSGDPIPLDLNADFGSYTFSDDLLYWHRPGVRRDVNDDIVANYAAKNPGSMVLTRNNVADADLSTDIPRP